MSIAIHWFRQDLRLSDNPSLCAAVGAGSLLPIFILDDDSAGQWQRGGASRWWLHHSLCALNESLNGQLRVYSGPADVVLGKLCDEHDITAVHWNRCYEPWRIHRDKAIRAELSERGIDVHSHNASLLWEPWQVKKGDGTHYKVFTPYFKNGCLKSAPPAESMPAPVLSDFASGDFGAESNIDALNLLPTIPWDEQMRPHWEIGEAGALKRLQTFANDGITDYKEGRNLPARTYVSRLSPHLHFGEISVRQVWHSIARLGDDENIYTFKSELGWREFAYSLLYHHPNLPEKCLQEKFEGFGWHLDEKLLRAWQQGKTGYPIVDAGMRELWQTGYMHNRVRMITASFLVKNLLIDWRAGQDWFWDCLVDADLASNSASWQWVAGCGADAAPYFRIFNPVTQGEKFDPEGEYTLRYCPELAKLPKKYLYKPFDAPSHILQAAGITLGINYPHPVVDVKSSRQLALDTYQALKEQ